MDCIVTAGPTYEPLDQVRRLTNFSTGRLGSELALYLAAQGYSVHLLLGAQATCERDIKVANLETFTTTADLRSRLQKLASPEVKAVFHAAAVSDFSFGKVFQQSPSGSLIQLKSGKIPTVNFGPPLLAELLPTSKIIADLFSWFGFACLVGWKYEVEGTRTDALAKANLQILQNHTHVCVVNGPAYGEGFGLLTWQALGKPLHYASREELYKGLADLIKPNPAASLPASAR